MSLQVVFEEISISLSQYIRMSAHYIFLSQLSKLGTLWYTGLLESVLYSGGGVISSPICV